MYTTLLFSCFIAIAIATPKCSLEITPGADNYVSFGAASCVLKNTDIQTVEAWVYPITEGQSFGEGIVFNSGWYTVNGVQRAVVLSIKENHQLMGITFSKSIGSSSVTEHIGASSQNFLVPNTWNHIMWNPREEEGRFHVGNSTSQRGVIYGSSLNGIGNFMPGPDILVGQSFSGRISAVRIWSSSETPSSVAAFFNSRATACSKGVGSTVLAFWDFTSCTGCHVNSFVGGSCGKFHPNKNVFKWVQNNADQIQLVDPSSDNGHGWVDVCSAPTSCTTSCHTTPSHHFTAEELKSITNNNIANNNKINTATVQNNNNNNNNSTQKKNSCFFGWMKRNPHVVIIAAASIVMIVITAITVVRSCRKTKLNEESAELTQNDENKNNSEESDDNHNVMLELPDMKPVYVPLNQ